MKNLFTPIFLCTLSLLALSHTLDIANYEILPPLLILFISAALLCYYFQKYLPTYILLSLAISLVITGDFIKEKETFYNTIEIGKNWPGNGIVLLSGRLLDFPEIHSDHSKILLHVNSIKYNQHIKKISFNVMIEINGHHNNLNRNDTINIYTRLFQNTMSKNFYPDPSENLRLLRKIHFYGYCKSQKLITLTQRTHWLWRTLGNWRQSIRHTIEQKYNIHPNDTTTTLNKKGVLLLAMLLGDRGELEELHKEQLINAGIFHLLAISGAHIGIIALGCLILLKHAKIHFRKRYLITSLIILLYLALSGFKIPAERAVIMALLLFLAKILYLKYNMYNIISCCGLILLTINPMDFLDAGFTLTFALTTAIVMGRHIFLPLFKLTKWQNLSKKHSSISETLSANLSAAIIALPLSLYFFQRYTFSGFLASLLLVPLTAVILGIGFLLIPFAPLAAGVSSLLLTVLNPLLSLFFYLSYFFSDILDLTIYRAAPPFFLVLLMLVAFALLPGCKARKQKISTATTILLIAISISINLNRYTPTHLEVFFLDVGQGDAEVVVFPGGDALLIDGGGSFYGDFPVGKNILLPFILQKGIHIRWVAVSHYHPDHIRGITEIISILKPEELWLAADASPDRLYEELITTVPRPTRTLYITAPTQKTINNCQIKWLYPTTIIKNAYPHNNNSQVLKISDGFHSFLFPGDIEIEVEKELLNTGPSNLQADVLKVPHHGSKTSSHRAFLKAVQPRLAIFSYALANRFRFPHQTVLRHYHAAHIPCLATAKRGAIHLISTRTKLLITTAQ